MNARLNREKMRHIRTDVMFGTNNGIYHQRLKADIPLLIFVRCACYSRHLAVSSSGFGTLLRNLNLLIRGTFVWFSSMPMR